MHLILVVIHTCKSRSNQFIDEVMDKKEELNNSENVLKAIKVYETVATYLKSIPVMCKSISAGPGMNWWPPCVVHG